MTTIPSQRILAEDRLITLSNIDLACTRLLDGVAKGQHKGAQLYVATSTHEIVNYACGWSKANYPMTTKTVLQWFSSGKPLTAVAVAQLLEGNELNLDSRISRYISQFKGDKEEITLRHILTHTGGFPNAIDRFMVEGRSYAEVIDLINKAPLETKPGSTAAYHPLSSWFVLGELVRIIDGRSIDRYLSDELFKPLEMSATFSIDHLSDSDWSRADNGHPAYSTAEEVQSINSLNQPPNPGSGLLGTARDLGLFYRALLSKKIPMLAPQTIELFTACHRWGLPDLTLAKAPLAWGLGFALHGNSDFDRQTSRRVFGHPGMVSSVAWADPVIDLVCVVITTGFLKPMDNARRLRSITEPIVSAKLTN